MSLHWWPARARSHRDASRSVFTASLSFLPSPPHSHNFLSVRASLPFRNDAALLSANTKHDCTARVCACSVNTQISGPRVSRPRTLPPNREIIVRISRRDTTAVAASSRSRRRTPSSCCLLKFFLRISRRVR
jgi:hypothetical protein